MASLAGRAQAKHRREVKTREETSRNQEPKYSPGLAPTKIVLERAGERQGGQCMGRPLPACPRAPEPSLTMAELEEPCLPGTQIYLKWDGNRNKALLSHHLHLQAPGGGPAAFYPRSAPPRTLPGPNCSNPATFPSQPPPPVVFRLQPGFTTQCRLSQFINNTKLIDPIRNGSLESGTAA